MIKKTNKQTKANKQKKKQKVYISDSFSAFPTPAILPQLWKGVETVTVACRQGSRSQIWNAVGWGGGGGGELTTTESGRNKQGPGCSPLGNCVSFSGAFATYL